MEDLTDLLATSRRLIGLGGGRSIRSDLTEVLTPTKYDTDYPYSSKKTG
jgi:hypothetical protein